MTTPTIETFTDQAADWLAANATPRVADDAPTDMVWGEGDFSVAVFHNLAHDDEAAHLQSLRAWQQKKAEQGYHAITWPERFGGLGLTKDHAMAFARVESNYELPYRHELFSVTVGLMAATVNVMGTEEQKDAWIPGMLRTDDFTCQLFSEPGAGSDLASLGCRAERDGDEWIVNGQKVWTSGAQFSKSGLLLARSDVDAPKHRGITAFIVPFDAPGVEVRPIKQMSGGTSFNEVFFQDARFPDSMRLGDVGDGWKVALTTLGYERDHSASGGSAGSSGRAGGNWQKLLGTAQAYGGLDNEVGRAEMMELYCQLQAQKHLNKRASDLARGGTPGPEGSLGKLMWTIGLAQMSDVVSSVLGPRLIADTDEWGAYAWEEHVLGAPGYRIAGGSDEVQRNIIGERVLGLPAEPKIDKSVPWKDIPK